MLSDYRYLNFSHALMPYYSLLFIVTAKSLKYNLSGVTLGNSSSSSHKTKTLRGSRDEELYQTRLRQQETYNQRAKEILEQRRQSESNTERNDAEVAKESDPIKKNKKKKPTIPASTSGKSTATGGGYNPMQPWTSSAGGGGYRYVGKCICNDGRSKY
jgi:hypothetical protein